MEHNELIKQLDERTTRINERLNNHSRYLVNDLLPVVEKIQKELEKLWISEDRFTELERAVADLAIKLYNLKTHPADSRLRKDGTSRTS